MRHSASDEPISLYVEVADGRTEVFVRDRGQGFDPDAIPEDRRGVRESIMGRMARHGGTAAVHSTPGQGTEVELVLDDSRALPTVVLVDDHAIFRAGVRAELDGLVTILGEAGDVESAVREITERAPDVVLLDVHLPGGGGVEILRRLATEAPEPSAWRSRSPTTPRTSSRSSAPARAAT